MSKSEVDGSDIPLEVWRFTDGKPGHEKQTDGLLHAMAERISLNVHPVAIPAKGGFRRFRQWLFGQFPDGKDLPNPDLLVGAGHRLHIAMLAARKARGGRLLVCMKPSLPLSWFDLALVPRHDHPPDTDKVLRTRGALTTVRPSSDKDSQSGLFLIGGPSPHFDWSDEEVAEQVRKVILGSEEEIVDWKLTTSRRTPRAFLERLKSAELPNLTIFPVEETSSGWVDDQLARSGVGWVTEDSVSMVHEALTSGCLTGLLQLPVKARPSRVALGILDLTKKEWLTSFAKWDGGDPLRSAPPGFDEATRCAEWVVDRWFQSRGSKGSSAKTRS